MLLHPKPVSIFWRFGEALPLEARPFEHAVAAGATVSMPLADQFWGERYGRVVDPTGHEWSIATHKKDLTPEEIRKAAEARFSQLPPHEC